LDKELERRGHQFVRYADDCSIYVRSRHAGERVLASIERFLRERLRLTVNRDKSAVDRPRTRAKKMVQRGLAHERAWTSAMKGRGSWWNAGASHVNQAVPTRYLSQLGLVIFLQESRRLAGFN